METEIPKVKSDKVDIFFSGRCWYYILHKQKSRFVDIECLFTGWSAVQMWSVPTVGNLQTWRRRDVEDVVPVNENEINNLVGLNTQSVTYYF